MVELVEHPPVVDLRVAVHQHVAEPHGPRERGRRRPVEQARSASRRNASAFDAGVPNPSAATMCWAASTQASIAVCRVYLTSLIRTRSARSSSRSRSRVDA